jgi:Putative MetA-pathway of phenol degradation
MNRSRLVAAVGVAIFAGSSAHAEVASGPRPWWMMPTIFSPEQTPQEAEAAAPQVADVPVDAAADPNVAQAPISPAKPGVLTRKGTLVIEPSLEYQHTNINNFVAGGVAILDTVLVGNIQATQSNRDAITATLGFRYGFTDRIEGEFRVPYIYRADGTTNTIVNTNNTQSTTDLHDMGIGDLEGALHYQINDGSAELPIFIANLRVKSVTGNGPFDVARDPAGVETQLATGSGFWGIEPGLTVVMPSEPAVFFGSLGYLYNVPESVNQQIGTRFLGNVDPGNAIRIGMGMGLALNEKVSFSIGYQHDFISSTRFHFTDGDFNSPELSVGTLNLGVNWQINDNTALNVGVGIGVTRDSPDIRLMARVPISLKLF